ncbi:hypothetical protein [Gordonia aichiensis]|uniref:hypothetical protein n=1 Tax=Gordonia aichiensis TaxID=36820 RepID=UPI003263C2A9
MSVQERDLGEPTAPSDDAAGPRRHMAAGRDDELDPIGAAPGLEAGGGERGPVTERGRRGVEDRLIEPAAEHLPPGDDAVLRCEQPVESCIPRRRRPHG